MTYDDLFGHHLTSVEVEALTWRLRAFAPARDAPPLSAPRARGVGVGYELMRACVEIARRAGCVGIDARALPGDRETKNFFESFGLVARSLVVHSALD